MEIQFGVLGEHQRALPGAIAAFRQRVRPDHGKGPLANAGQLTLLVVCDTAKRTRSAEPIDELNPVDAWTFTHLSELEKLGDGTFGDFRTFVERHAPDDMWKIEKLLDPQVRQAFRRDLQVAYAEEKDGFWRKGRAEAFMTRVAPVPIKADSQPEPAAIKIDPPADKLHPNQVWISNLSVWDTTPTVMRCAVRGMEAWKQGNLPVTERAIRWWSRIHYEPISNISSWKELVSFLSQKSNTGHSRPWKVRNLLTPMTLVALQHDAVLLALQEHTHPEAVTWRNINTHKYRQHLESIGVDEAMFNFYKSQIMEQK